MPNTVKEEEDIPDFSRSQLHIMQILWDAEDYLKPAEIEAEFEWEIDNATLRSTLKVLIDRGELIRERRGKAYFYYPAKKKQKALSSVFSGLAKVFAKGSKTGLIAQLLQDSSLSEQDRLELEKMAERESDSTNP